MKNFIVCVLLLSICITLASCANTSSSQSTPAATTNTTTQETTLADTQPVIIAPTEQMPMISVALPVQTHSVTHDNGTVLFQNIYQDISLIVPDPEVANQIILDFLNRTDMTESANQLTEQAKADYSESLEYWSPYLSRITYDPVRLDSSIMSMYGSYVSYSGAAHAEATYRSVTYDLLTGSVLSLDDILTDSVVSEDIYKLVLENIKNDTSLYNDYENTVKSRFQKSFSSEKDWYLSDIGLCFFFSPYEIAPYSSGAIIATIPYENLTGILEDAYFPAERITVSGNIFTSAFQEEDLEDYTQIAEVILDPEGEKLILHTDDAVYDVRIEVGSWSADGSVYTPTNAIYAGYRLTPGDAIMINAHLNETLPTLRLSYTTESATTSKFISWNSDAGLPVLVD